MAITTQDGALAGMKYLRKFGKAVTGTMVAGQPRSLWYLNGVPGPAAVSSAGVAGEALTSVAGQIPFSNPVSGNTHLARFQAQATIGGVLSLCDRLWHNSGLNVTLNTAQTVNSVAWPARDANGSTNGEGVLIALETATALGAGTPTLTLAYTNSAGVDTRTATNFVATSASSAVGSFFPFGLQAGDLGVRSIQTFTQSATMTSGTHQLVAYRVLAELEITSANIPNAIDMLTGGFPQLYDNTVPFLVFWPSTTTTSNISGHVIYSQG